MKTLRVLTSLFIAFLLLVPTTFSVVSAVTPTKLIPGQADHVGHIDVQSLREIKAPITGQFVTRGLLHPWSSQAYDRGKTEVGRSGYVPSGENTKTVTGPSTPEAPLAASVGLVLDGVPGVSPNPCICTPPDPNNGVGPNHVFEMVNLAGIIYTKSGTIAKATFSLADFFKLQTSTMSDPQIFYDSNSGRWFASILDINNGRIQIAVSTSNDPTGTFNLYSVSAGINSADQPFIGTSDDNLVISANIFDFVGAVYLGAQYWVLSKSELVAGQSSVDLVTTAPDPNVFSLQPARHLTSTSILYMLSNCSGSCPLDPQGMTTTATLYAISGSPPGTVLVTTRSVPFATSVSPPNAQQPGTATKLVTNDNRIQSVVWESNSLWASWNDACIPAGDTVVRSCLRLLQIYTSGTGVPLKVQDFDYSAKGEYYFYPAVSSYQGQLVVAFGRSSSSVYPSLLVTGRSPSDPVNTLQAPATIRSGTAADVSSRYGDYFGAATDPNPTATSTFWVSGEYRASSGFINWNTAIARVAPFAAPGLLAAPPVGLLVTVQSIFSTAYYNNTGKVTVQPASLALNMTVQSVNQTGISFSINSGRVTIGPSPIVSIQGVFDVISGTAFLYYYGRLTIQAQASELGVPPGPSQLLQLFLTGPARFQPPNAQTSYIWFARLFGFLYSSQTKIGLFFVINSPIWDLNVDGKVDIVDMAIVASNIGKNNLQTCLYEAPNSASGYSSAYYADLDGDGVITVADLIIVSSHFGASH